ADRVNRVGLIRINALFLMLLAIPLWGFWVLPYWALILLSCVLGILQFTLYPIGAAFANDNVEPDHRVGLSGILLMAYGLGACVGPLIAGTLMREFNAGMLFIFSSAGAAVMVLFVRPQRVTGINLTEDAPTHFVPMAEQQATSTVAALDPRVDLDTDVSYEQTPPVEAA
ncbi:MAG TPA: MFS transporter, partial [Eoetvoesiella sp.]